MALFILGRCIDSERGKKNGVKNYQQTQPHWAFFFISYTRTTNIQRHNNCQIQLVRVYAPRVLFLPPPYLLLPKRRHKQNNAYGKVSHQRARLSDQRIAAKGTLIYEFLDLIFKSIFLQ